MATQVGAKKMPPIATFIDPPAEKPRSQSENDAEMRAFFRRLKKRG